MLCASQRQIHGDATPHLLIELLIESSKVPGFCLNAELMKSVDVLCSAVQDSTLSVRVSAASALANLADALQQQQQELNMQLMPSLTNLAAGMLPTSIQPKSIQCQVHLLPTCLQMVSQPTCSHSAKQWSVCRSSVCSAAMNLYQITYSCGNCSCYHSLQRQ